MPNIASGANNTNYSIFLLLHPKSSYDFFCLNQLPLKSRFQLHIKPNFQHKNSTKAKIVFEGGYKSQSNL
jgi:hypothetical protein